MRELSRWFGDQRIDAAVVGVSGGVDSALVLALLRAVHESGALRRVVGLLLPVHARGATSQDRATGRGRVVCDALGAEAWEAPLTEAHVATIASLSRASGLAFDAWAEGQALSVARTPALYGAAALLKSHGYRSVVVGTTNRDEGSYLGFYGKASDGAVDLQPISDLHKSEVRAIARHLGVPEAIVDAVPAGDVHDGRSDEEIIGASYDEVELFVRLRELGLETSLARSWRVVGLSPLLRFMRRSASPPRAWKSSMTRTRTSSTRATSSSAPTTAGSSRPCRTGASGARRILCPTSIRRCARVSPRRTRSRSRCGASTRGRLRPRICVSATFRRPRGRRSAWPPEDVCAWHAERLQKNHD